MQNGWQERRRLLWNEWRTVSYRGQLSYSWGQFLLRCLPCWPFVTMSQWLSQGRQSKLNPPLWFSCLFYIPLTHGCSPIACFICWLSCLVPNFPCNYRQKSYLLFVTESLSPACGHLISSWWRNNWDSFSYLSWYLTFLGQCFGHIFPFIGPFCL